MIKPSKITLHKHSKTLELIFGEQHYTLPAELLRVYSPSAEVRGHGVGQEVLVSGKLHVGINTLTPVGNYGVQIDFDDQHNSGIYSWSYLQALGEQQELRWQDYLDRLQQQHKHRDPDTNIVQLMPGSQ